MGNESVMGKGTRREIQDIAGTGPAVAGPAAAGRSPLGGELADRVLAFRPSLRRRVKRRLNTLDERLFRQVAAAHLPGLEGVLPPLSRAADNSVLWMGIAAALASSGEARLRRGATRGLVAVSLVSPLVNLLGKQAFARSRPSIAGFPIARLGRVPTSHSFPSGHSASAAAFAAGVAMEAPAAVAVPVAAAAGAVCFSRVYIGVHYPGDVVAGASIGVAAALLTGRLWPRRRRR